MQLSPQQEATIRKASRGGLQQEACGFILSTGEVWRTTNVHETPADAFRIDPAMFAKAEEIGVKAVWHSHATYDGLSPADQAAVRADGELAWVVYCLRTDAFHIVDPQERGPLIGRTFSYGILDCYSLVRDALWRHHDIELPAWKRGPWGEWGEPDFTVFDEQVEKHCRQVGAERLLPGDIVFMGKDHTNHIGVLTAPDRLLHHMADRRSEEVVYGEWWRARTRSIWRPLAAQPKWAS